MYDDVTADYWKEIFVHLQHKNMTRIGAERLNLQDCDGAFKAFSSRHPEIKPEIYDGESYKTWEIFISDNVKLRLFFQNQIKGSLMQKDGNDLVKICDAKFPNNPFPEIEEFLSRRDFYLKELEQKQSSSIKMKRGQKLAGEFIKAYLLKKITDSGITWSLESAKNEFVLTLQSRGKVQKYNISPEAFKSQIDSLQF